MKLNERNILNVEYKLRNGFVAKLELENGELVNITGIKNDDKCKCEQKCKCNDDEKYEDKPFIVKNIDVDKAKELMGTLKPIKSVTDNEGNKERKQTFDRFLNEWNKTDKPYYSKMDKIKRDAERDKLLIDFILSNEKLFKQGKVKNLLQEMFNSNVPQVINNAFKDESIDKDILTKVRKYSDEIKEAVKKDFENCEEKEVFEEMADKYTPTNFNSEDCWKRPKLDEYRKKKGFPDEEDEKKVIIESKKDIFGTTIGPEEGVEINGKQIVIKEYNTNVDDYGKNL